MGVGVPGACVTVADGAVVVLADAVESCRTRDESIAPVLAAAGGVGAVDGLAGVPTLGRDASFVTGALIAGLPGLAIARAVVSRASVVSPPAATPRSRQPISAATTKGRTMRARFSCKFKLESAQTMSFLDSLPICDRGFIIRFMPHATFCVTAAANMQGSP